MALSPAQSQAQSRASNRPLNRPLNRRRVLALRALGLGDLLAAAPAIRAVRRALPDHEFLLAADRALAPVVQSIGCVDALVHARPLEPLRWPAVSPPDVAVNLHGRGPQSHQVLQALATPHLVAFECVEAGVRGPRWRSDEHEVWRWIRLITAELGGTADQHDLRLAHPRAEPDLREMAVVHPGAASQSRRWPPDRFAAVARYLHARGERVVVTGGRGERSLAQRVADDAGLGPESVWASRTDLRALMAVVAHARLVVSGDTGVAHLATSYATPSVVLFGPVSPQQWGPVTDGPHTCLWKPIAGSPGDPHGDRIDPSLEAIQVAEVITALESRVAAKKSMVRQSPSAVSTVGRH
jgi:ADP-heptose:LPS heptosyltransferase